jgi:hypothetical protein
LMSSFFMLFIQDDLGRIKLKNYKANEFRVLISIFT